MTDEAAFFARKGHSTSPHPPILTFNRHNQDYTNSVGKKSRSVHFLVVLCKCGKTAGRKAELPDNCRFRPNEEGAEPK